MPRDKEDNELLGNMFLKMGFAQAMSLDTQEQRFNLANALGYRFYNEGDLICEEGEVGTEMYFLVDGIVDIVQSEVIPMEFYTELKRRKSLKNHTHSK
jgi:signal-transduction protein with cAMP-binding, CBS, and nucleotidyltransferase domain